MGAGGVCRWEVLSQGLLALTFKDFKFHSTGWRILRSQRANSSLCWALKSSPTHHSSSGYPEARQPSCLSSLRGKKKKSHFAVQAGSESGFRMSPPIILVIPLPQPTPSLMNKTHPDPASPFDIWPLKPSKGKNSERAGTGMFVSTSSGRPPPDGRPPYKPGLGFLAQ